MLETIKEILLIIVDFIQNSGVVGAVISCGLISIESIVPIMPLILFVTINFLVFGKILGFILSWIFTILGCIMSYYIFKNGFGKKFDNLTENKELLKKYKKSFKDISVVNLALLIALPFTPAFMVNIAAGLVKMDFKKYLIALLIGKVSLVYYMGFIGLSLIESIKNPMVLIKIAILLLITYIISIILKKLLKL